MVFIFFGLIIFVFRTLYRTAGSCAEEADIAPSARTNSNTQRAPISSVSILSPAVLPPHDRRAPKPFPVLLAQLELIDRHAGGGQAYLLSRPRRPAKGCAGHD